MSVYMILDAEVHDPVEYEKYKAAAPQYVARHGGEYCCLLYTSDAADE